MPFSATVPVSALTSAALKKPTPGELRAYAKGIIAHIAIQTMYRIQHAGNFIITERSIWVGDTKASTISKILDNVDRVVDLAEAAAKASKRPKPSITGTSPEDLWVVLTYLIDLATTESSLVGKVIRKRYDIVDFGPMVISPVSQSRFGEAYEIKSNSNGQAEEGKNYITQQTKNYNQTLQTLSDTFEKAFNIAGLGGYQLRPGQKWPPIREILLVGPNLLLFWLDRPGVILYEWISFKRMSMKQLWESRKKAEEEVRKLFEAKSELKPEVIIVLMLAMIAASFAVAMIALAIAEVAAAAEVGEATMALATALARLAQGGGLPAAGLIGASAAAAPKSKEKSTRSSPLAASHPEMSRLEGVLEALEKMERMDVVLFSQSYSSPLSSQEDLSGGTPLTSYEQAVLKMADTIVSETVFLYSVQVGQGEEFLNENNLNILKDNLRLWLQEFISIYGLDNLLMLTGQTKSSELTEATALEIAQVIVAVASGNLDSTRYGKFLNDFFSLSTEDIEESLPRGYNDDGEG